MEAQGQADSRQLGNTDGNRNTACNDIDTKALYYQILKSGIEDNGNLIQATKADKKILSRIHSDLLSENVTNRKASLYLLRLLSTSETEDPNSPMTLFFDTFEMLDEMQFHIIEPFLTKLDERSDEFQTGEFLLRAYLTILQKMIQHDNRKIVEKGLNAFIKGRSTTKFQPEQNDEAGLANQNLYLNFLEFKLLPKIRDGVGWIFPEAEDFFTAAKKFGNFLITMEEDINPLSIFQFSFKFLVESQDKGLSPFAALFILKAFHSFILSQLPKLPPFNNEDLSLLNTFLGRISTIANHYGRSIIETEVIAIFVLLYPTAAVDVKSFGVRQFFGKVSRTGIFLNRTLFQNLDLALIEFPDKPPPSASEDDWSVAGRLLFLIVLQKLVVDDKYLPSGEVKDRLDLLDGAAGMVEFLQCLGLCSSHGMGIKLRNEIFNDVIDKAIHPDTCNYRVLEIIIESESRFQLNDITLVVSFQILHDEVTNTLDGVGKTKTMDEDFNLISRLLILSKLFVNFYSPKVSEICTCAVFKKILELTHGSDRNRNLISKFYEAKINLLSHILQTISTSGNTQLEINVPPVLSIVESMDIMPPTGIMASIQFITSALSFPELCPAMQEMKDFVSYCWSELLEMKRSRSHVFWQCATSFVNLITHDYFNSSGILAQYAGKIFEAGETIIGLPLILLENLSNSKFESMVAAKVDEITQICLRATYFGTHLMKQTRLISRIYDYEQWRLETGRQKQEPVYGVNSWDRPEFILTADCNTRILGLVTLLDLLSVTADGRDSSSLNGVVGQLLSANDKESDRQSRYYGNSAVHRNKQRIAQALLLLQPRYTSNIAKEVNLRLMASLTRDSPQLSVRYLMEWIIALNLIKFPEIHDEFFQASVTNMGVRAGFGCCFSTISYQAIQGILAEPMLSSTAKLFIQRALDMLVNLLIGQHLPVRVYSSVCFLRIYRQWILKLSVPSVERYDVIYKNLEQGSLATSGTFLKTVRAVEDFWIDYFHPVTDFNFQAVLIDVPLLSGMSFDENIQRKDLRSLIVSCPKFRSKQIPPIRHHSKARREGYSSRLAAFRQKDQNKLTFQVEGNREMGEEAPEELHPLEDEQRPLPTGNTLIQKKVNPWKFLPVAEEELDQFSEIIQERKKASTEEGLVVVASLIDRIPNLGGLCRTSEIFGVSKLVVPSLKILNDQQFKALSVSSHNWVEIMEVLPRELEDFLRSYSAKGYTILAIEQAVGSIPLNQFRFPKKSVLLLGHEKRGIPAELLHVVDKCLEIPQLGVVRSLNVHVTGAIAIWQYASEHLLPIFQQ